MKTFFASSALKRSHGGFVNSLFQWSDGLRYALAPLVVAVAFFLQLALTPILRDDAPYLFFVPAVLVAGGSGGLRPGLVATVLSTLLGFFVIAAVPHSGWPEIVNAVTFAMIGVGITWSGELLQRNRIKAAGSTREALGARGTPRIHPRYHSRRDDRHR